MMKLMKRLRLLEKLRDKALYGEVRHALELWADEETAQGALFGGLLDNLEGADESFDLALDELMEETEDELD